MPDEPFWPPENYYRVSLKPLIFDEQGRLLVCQGADGAWTMPGGGWDYGEAPVQQYADQIWRTVEKTGKNQ